MPWRIPPGSGVRPDPYRIWLSEVMLQQTTVAAAKGHFLRFTALWPDVHALAAAPQEDVMAAWAGLGYYARARNLHKCARMVSAELAGIFPDTLEGLLTLPGVGPYTAAAISAIAFDRPSVVVDGNVERVMARLHALETPLPDAKPALKAHAADLTPDDRPGDYAQAVMDLGATICTPKRPACALCPWRPECAGHAQGIAEQLPRKRPKAEKPVRYGHVWVTFDREGRILTERRPETGLLGGMLALPTSDWTDSPRVDPPSKADWKDVGEVRHTFTHFHLILKVWATRLGSPGNGEFRQPKDAIEAMPTVFAKAARQAVNGL